MNELEKKLAASTGRSDFRIEKLAGDASDRSFYRVIYDDADAAAGGRRTAVLMLLGESQEPGELPYLNVQRHMKLAGLPVPDIYVNDASNGFILMEDFGDATVEDAIEGADDDYITGVYKKAADLILDLQFGRGRDIDKDCIIFQYAFDVEKLMFEFNFFYEHAIGNYRKRTPGPADEKTIRDGFTHIAETLAAEPRYVTHRDYHSRNLMVRRDGSLGMVDFQDARMGPAQYDLASLLMDSYVAIPERVADDIYNYYYEAYSGSSDKLDSRERFDMIFDYMVVQRNIKAAGSFAYLDVVKKKDRYLKYFRPCLEKAGPALDRLSGPLGGFRPVLGDYIEELKES